MVSKLRYAPLLDEQVTISRARPDRPRAKDDHPSIAVRNRDGRKLRLSSSCTRLRHGAVYVTASSAFTKPTLACAGRVAEGDVMLLTVAS